VITEAQGKRYRNVGELARARADKELMRRIEASEDAIQYLYTIVRQLRRRVAVIEAKRRNGNDENSHPEEH
jgi:hypothetical protein